MCDTNVPPVVPRTVFTRPWEASTRSASRTVLRLTPKLPPISLSGGRRSPGTRDPSRISSRSWSATCWQAGRSRLTGRAATVPLPERPEALSLVLDTCCSPGLAFEVAPGLHGAAGTRATGTRGTVEHTSDITRHGGAESCGALADGRCSAIVPGSTTRGGNTSDSLVKAWRHIGDEGPVMIVVRPGSFGTVNGYTSDLNSPMMTANRWK